MSNLQMMKSVVWNTANTYLRSVASPEDYGDYILPFIVLRRVECVLDLQREEIAAFVEKIKDTTPEQVLDMKVRHKFDTDFYNTTSLSLTKIKKSDDSVLDGMKLYLDSFSAPVRAIWEAFEFKSLLGKLDRANRLWGMVDYFAGLDLHPDSMGDGAMSDLFEHLMYMSFSAKGKTSGEYYTPRDAIRVMVDILFRSDDTDLKKKGAIRTVYDPTAGTAGMLILAERALKAINPKIDVTVAGQELMAKSFAIGRSDLIIQGGDPESIKFGDTLADDKFAGQQFDYILANPPYGTKWEASEDAVREEAEREGSRFSHGLPSISDGQLLFMSHIVHKLEDADGETFGGRGVVVSDGSPLFSSGKGETSIRTWLLKYVDAIVALPTNIFYNTGIATFLWFFDKNKEPHRQGKIQLIDATDQWKSLRKGMGEKRRELTDDNRIEIVKRYVDYENTEFSKILTPEDLGFTDIPMYRPHHYRVEINDDTVAAALDHKQAVPEHEEVIRACAGVAWNDLPARFKEKAKKTGVKYGIGLIRHVQKCVAVEDPEAPVAVDDKGNVVVNKQSKIVERVPLTEDINEHMEREVLPFAPDLIWDKDDSAVGYEISFTRLFYKPGERRNLHEVDADIQASMERMFAEFQEVKE